MSFINYTVVEYWRKNNSVMIKIIKKPVVLLVRGLPYIYAKCNIIQ